jgi:hypothetical protein
VTPAQRRMHDIAYACFLVPGTISLAITIGSAFPMDDGTAGGFGFLVLVPLAVLSLATIPIGIYCSVVLWRDGVLPCLSILTILLIVEVMTEAGSVAFYNASTGPVYGVIVLVLEASWFLWRRRLAVQVA